MDHRVKIISYLDRSLATCSCGMIDSKEQFGDRRTVKARFDILSHLEKVFGSLDGSVEPDYQIKASGSLVCPICKEKLDLTKGDMGLLEESDPSVISCKDGHQFDCYLKNNTLFLFTEGVDTHSPFSTD